LVSTKCAALFLCKQCEPSRTLARSDDALGRWFSPVRVHLGARIAIYDGWVCPHGRRAGTLAKLSFKAHPHMLRHACGYALANAGHDTRRIQSWLGHRSIQHTVRYTELSPAPFKEFWRAQ